MSISTPRKGYTERTVDTVREGLPARLSPWILAELNPDDRLRTSVGATCHVLLLPRFGVAG